MPAMPPPIADERAGLKEYLAAQQYAFHAHRVRAHRRAGPRHAVGQRAVDRRADQARHQLPARLDGAGRRGPGLTAADKRPMEEQAAEYGDEFVMRDDETLADVLAAFDAQNAETIRLIETVDLGAAVPVPQRRAVVPEGRRGVVGALGDAST